MPDINSYVVQLTELKKKDPVKYAETMKSYQDSYPQFYAQLIAVMPKEEIPGMPAQAQKMEVPVYNSKTKIMDFLREYWKYLIFIGAGSVTVIILAIMLIARLRG